MTPRILAFSAFAFLIALALTDCSGAQAQCERTHSSEVCFQTLNG